MLTPGIITNKPDESISKELLISKFKSFARDFFQLNHGGDEDYLTYIKRGSQLAGFQLPLDKVELFINSENAPYYWLCDIPAILKAEEWLRNEAKNRNVQIEEYRNIKEFFVKWALLKTDQEKRYFALSISKLVEKDSQKNNFLKLILYSVILTYDRKMFDPEKAIELNNIAADLIKQSTLDDVIKTELLYVLKIFAGFLFLKQYLYDEAVLRFSEAAEIKPSGITARFYTAYSEKKQGSRDVSLLILGEIPEYDRELMKYAMSTNNLPFLYFMLKNAFTYNILREMEFADMYDDLQGMISSKVQEEKINVEQIQTMLSNLNDLHLQNFYNDELKSILGFLDKFLQNFSGNTNQLLNFCYSALKEKYERISQLLVQVIETEKNQEIFERLSRYDAGINDNLEAIKHLTVELEELKKNYKKKLEESIQYVEKSIKDNIALIERRIENIHHEKKYNPGSTFNSLMVYNFVITLLVFVIGGFSGCYNGTIGNVYDFRDVMSTVILSGVKWSAITFLLGMIIAMLASGFAIVEKMNERGNLSRRIEFLRAQLDREIDGMKRDNEKKMTTLTENFNERIEEHKKNVDSLRKEKDSNYKELLNASKSHIDQTSQKINQALLLA